MQEGLDTTLLISDFVSWIYITPDWLKMEVVTKSVIIEKYVCPAQPITTDQTGNIFLKSANQNTYSACSVIRARNKSLIRSYQPTLLRLYCPKKSRFCHFCADVTPPDVYCQKLRYQPLGVSNLSSSLSSLFSNLGR